MWVDLGELVERLIISISPHFRDGGGDIMRELLGTTLVREGCVAS
jgi:hypothetical protein